MSSPHPHPPSSFKHFSSACSHHISLKPRPLLPLFPICQPGETGLLLPTRLSLIGVGAAAAAPRSHGCCPAAGAGCFRPGAHHESSHTGPRSSVSGVTCPITPCKVIIRSHRVFAAQIGRKQFEGALVLAFKQPQKVKKRCCHFDFLFF